MKRIIMHVDVNSAFLSWEAVYRIYHLGAKTDLRNEVAAVGGDMAARHGIILAKSIPAKKYGIQTGESIIEARQKCPFVKLVPPNYSLYEACSNAFMEILRQYTPDVEQYSIDEAFLDMTGTEGLWGEPILAADRIRRQIKEELGFTVNIGISENKVLAKMASDFQKPDKVHTLWKNEISSKMWPLPVSDLFFVGHATERKLHAIGVKTIGELAAIDPRYLRPGLKSHGDLIWNFANGRDVSAVQPVPAENKGYGNSTTIAFDVTDASTAKLVLLSLAESIGTRLRAAGVRAEVIAVGIRTFDLKYAGHQMTLYNPTDVTLEIHRYACQLFDELWDGTPIRHLGIHASRVKDHVDIRQMDMFETMDYNKQKRLESMVDVVRRRYGRDSMMRASFAGSKIDHFGGGISREKRTVDYSKIQI